MTDVIQQLPEMLSSVAVCQSVDVGDIVVITQGLKSVDKTACHWTRPDCCASF